MKPPVCANITHGTSRDSRVRKLYVMMRCPSANVGLLLQPLRPTALSLHVLHSTFALWIALSRARSRRPSVLNIPGILTCARFIDDTGERYPGIDRGVKCLARATKPSGGAEKLEAGVPERAGRPDVDAHKYQRLFPGSASPQLVRVA